MHYRFSCRQVLWSYFLIGSPSSQKTIICVKLAEKLTNTLSFYRRYSVGFLQLTEDAFVALERGTMKCTCRLSHDNKNPNSTHQEKIQVKILCKAQKQNSSHLRISPPQGFFPSLNKKNKAVRVRVSGKCVMDVRGDLGGRENTLAELRIMCIGTLIFNQIVVYIPSESVIKRQILGPSFGTYHPLTVKS